METLAPSSEMNHEQRKAMDVWLDHACLDNNFETLSDRGLCDLLKSDHGIEVGKSTIERWRNKYNWQSFLDLKIASAVVHDDDIQNNISLAIGSEVAKATVVDVKRNGELNALAYAIMEGELQVIFQKLQDGKRITTDEAKFAKDVATLTSGREDRLLDRAALMGAASKVGRDDFLNAIANTIIDIEGEEITVE